MYSTNSDSRRSRPFAAPVFPLVLTVLFAVGLSACDDDAPAGPDTDPTTFVVTIENLSSPADFVSTGIFNTPAGATEPGPATPGAAYETTVAGAPGQVLHFATMFVQSNDWFFAPGPEGIELYDADGNPRSGDVTSEVMLWDAGTEADQEPGVGDNQAPRQAGPDTGPADPDATVRLVQDATLPPNEDFIHVTLTPLGGGEFTLRIENTSTATTLQTSQGPVPGVLAPGTFAVGAPESVYFTPGESAPTGLEGLAEDGTVSTMAGDLDGRTGYPVPLSPGVYLVQEMGGTLFQNGAPTFGDGLEAIAEDGDPSALAQVLMSRMGVAISGVFNTPAGAGGPAPIFPGERYTFEFTAEEGQALTFATMFVQSNDLFYAPDENGIALFDATGSPRSGDVTAELLLWDAGTEVNERPAVGLFQAPRQPGPDSGADENGLVRPVDDGYSYPETPQVIRVTITPQG